MSEIISSVLVGSFVLEANATLVVNGNNRTVNAGTRYLYDTTGSLSWLDEIQTEVAAVVGGSTVVIGQDFKIRIISGGGALTLGVPTSLQALLGLPASPAVGTTVVADDVSTVLWAPGWPETTNGHPYGTDGFDVDDGVVTSSPTGLTVYYTEHHTTRIASWSWRFVRASRTWSSAEAGGEFKVFVDEVLRPRRRFKFYSGVAEDEASSTALTWPTAMGPYVLRELDPRWYQRAIPSTDSAGASFGFEAMKTGEIA